MGTRNTRTKADIQEPQHRGSSTTRAKSRTVDVLRERKTIAGLSLEYTSEQRHRELSVLYAISRAATQSLNLEQALHLSLRATLDALEIEVGGIFLLEPDQETLTLHVYAGLTDNFASAVRTMMKGEGVVGRAIAEKKTVVMDISEYRVERLAPLVTQCGFQTLAGTPLMAHGQVVGALNLSTRRSRAFPPSQVQLLTAIGEQLGTAVQHAQLYRSAQLELSERRKAEQALRTSEAKLRALIENSHDLIWSVDLQNRLTTANSAFLDKASSMLARQIRVGEILPASALSADGSLLWKDWYHRAFGGEAFSVEESNCLPIGECVYREHSFNPIRGEDNQIRGVACFSRDISERKRAEEAIDRLNGELIRRAGDLASANRELEAFSYSVSHDLRAPLRAIDGFSRILIEDHAPQLTPDAERYLQLVRASSQYMQRLVEDLLRLSRFGRQKLCKQPVEPSELVRQCLEELEAEQAGRSVEIIIAELPTCQADPVLLKQVWMNLLSNALKFTRKRVTAKIEIGSLPISDFRSKRADRSVAIADWLPDAVRSEITNLKSAIYYVRDNGVGFDMKYANKLFGVFQRLHRAEDYDGTGVGLAIVQRVIQRHGGHIWSEAAKNQGATFYFTLQSGES